MPMHSRSQHHRGSKHLFRLRAGCDHAEVVIHRNCAPELRPTGLVQGLVTFQPVLYAGKPCRVSATATPVNPAVGAPSAESPGTNSSTPK